MAAVLAVVGCSMGSGTPFGASDLRGQSPRRVANTRPSASELRVGQYVRLTAPGIAIDGGMVRSILGDTLLIGLDGLQWSVQASLLESISVRENRARRYAVVGFIPGAFIGVVTESLLNKMDCSTLMRDCPPPSIGKAVLIGGGVGVTMGFIVGKTTTVWRQIFP